MNYVLAFDQGTTSSRTIVFDHDGSVVSIAQKELGQIFPRPGWVEHDPLEIWRDQIETAGQALRAEGLGAEDISAIGITNQRETTVVWDRATGEPIYNAIVWQDRRTSELCDCIRADHADLIRSKTGLEVDAYFSASKIAWLLDNLPDARTRAENGELAFGTVDTWLVWNLTSGNLHITDPSNASRTMLFNINTLEWDVELLDIFDIPHMMLPTVRPSDESYGEVRQPDDLKGIKIAGIAGDQQAALFGQTCFRTGDVKNTYGTGCFMLQNVGSEPMPSKNRLLSTVAWQLHNKTEYALEGSVFIAGAVIQWLRDALECVDSVLEIEKLAGSVEDNDGVYFVPAFAGLGTPYWNQDARGVIIGLTRGTGKAHIARAALESIAFQTVELLTAMNADSRQSVSELRVDGGASKNDLLLQFQADVLQIPVVRSKVAETTALGAAYLAGLGCGFWSSNEDLASHWQVDRVFEPRMSANRAGELMSRWRDAVERSLDWAK